MNEEEYELAENIYHDEGYDKGEHCHKQSFLWGFQEGMKHPTDDVVKKILSLAWEYAASDVEVNNLTEEGEFNFVKQKLFEK